MKGEIALKILEAVGDTAINIADVFSAIIDSGYGASYGKLNYGVSKRQSERSVRNSNAKEKIDSKARFNSMLYKLKRDNLILKTDKKDNSPAIKLTPKGRRYLSILRKREKNKLPEFSYDNDKLVTDKFIIIIFDIPEKIRRKRNWLRSALNNLGLKMIQKSVWVGKTKLPKTFLDDVKNLNLVDFVEIFEITKTGSLKQIT